MWHVPQKSADFRKSDFIILCSGELPVPRGPYFVFPSPGSEMKLKLNGVSPSNPETVWQRSQDTDSFARQFISGFGGGTSPTKNEIGEWQPLHQAITSATTGSFSACGTASLKYSISSQ